MRKSLIALFVLGTTVVAVGDDEKKVVQQDALKVMVYSVADLVAEPPGGDAGQMQAFYQQLAVSSGVLNAVPGWESLEETAIEKNLDELVELLQVIAAPDTWEDVGGQGRVLQHRKTLSLVVRQSAQGHAEVSELLEQLRRENSVKVEVTFEFLTPKVQPALQASHPFQHLQGPPNPYGAVQPVNALQSPTNYYPASPSPPPPVGYRAPSPPLAQPVTPQPVSPQYQPQPAPVAQVPEEKIEPLQEVVKSLAAKYGATMNEKELQEFRERIANSATSEYMQTAVLENGRSRFVLAANATPIISADRRFVDVHISAPLMPTFASSVRIPDGESAVISLITADGDGTTVLMTAKIRTHEEEELKTAPALIYRR